METKKYFKKKTCENLFCQVCGTKEFKRILIQENKNNERIGRVEFSLHCKDDHVCHFKEYMKSSE